MAVNKEFKSDINPELFDGDEFLGSSEQADKNLHAFFLRCQEKAKHASEYYVNKSRIDKWRAINIRFYTGILLGFSALVPVLDAARILGESNWVLFLPYISIEGGLIAWLDIEMDPDQLGYFFAGLAALIYSMDQYMGHSSSWVRYMKTEAQLKELLSKFQADWLDACYGDYKDDGNAQQLSPRRKQKLAVLRAFWVEIDRIVRKETAKSEAEFQASGVALSSDLNRQFGRDDDDNGDNNRGHNPGSPAGRVASPPPPGD